MGFPPTISSVLSPDVWSFLLLLQLSQPVEQHTLHICGFHTDKLQLDSIREKEAQLGCLVQMCCHSLIDAIFAVDMVVAFS